MCREDKKPTEGCLCAYCSGYRLGYHTGRTDAYLNADPRFPLLKQDLK